MFSLACEKKYALDSFDHIDPAGVYGAYSSVFFNEAILKKYPNALVLDIGCAAGTLVESFIKMGIDAVGLEGSPRASDDNDIVPNDRKRDHSWGRIPHNLFNCDVTKPFTVFKDDLPAKFDIITSYEFFEHIEEYDLHFVLENIKKHIATQGVLLGSIADFGDGNRHRNVQKMDYWQAKFIEYGFKIEDHTFFNGPWIRGRGLWDEIREGGDEGFNFVVTYGE